ncbi:alpha/beta-hydrolase [Ophiobolus disseminans]|uniref:Alpha/beta-hydrolase n=1 Tax=Ophiobolus disseminans TaxID=1469910 RepID=A0A6A6ZNW3_9PLEO|nr:alpha/beta-hydrolase [Ophiobolus disseminans]
MGDSVGVLSLAPLIGQIVFTAITQALTYPLRSIRCTALYNDVLYAAVRCMMEHITIKQSRYLNSSTSALYAAFCKGKSITPNTEYIDIVDGDKVAAHWLGNPNARHVVLYFHGGGYTQSANHGNFYYLSRLVRDLNPEKGNSFAVLLLAYTLAPEATHPTQLREASAALTYLVNKTGRSPSDVFVSGDSAGGNLALMLLSHALHPHPQVPSIGLEAPLGGALLYSPWAGFGTGFASYDNIKLDMLSPLALRKWSAMFLNKANTDDPEADPGPVSGDAYTEACKNPASWWTGLHKVVGDVFVAYGSYEVLADPIKELEKNLIAGWAAGGGDPNRVIFVEGAKEAHIAPIIDIMTPSRKTKSSTQTAIEEWYKARQI